MEGGTVSAFATDLPVSLLLLVWSFMKILVANLGSTSFKYRLFDMTDEREIARGAIDRIGSDQSKVVTQIGELEILSYEAVENHGVAVRRCLEDLTAESNGCLASPSELAAVGFKTVHGGRLSGVHAIDNTVLEQMQEFGDVAPAHNPVYVSAIQSVRTAIGEIPLVAAFETDFHQTIPVGGRSYAIPFSWSEDFNIRRWGFHGASHRFIAERMAQLSPNSQRVISLHLGGSSSLCAIRDGKSIATTMGMSPQTGLPQNNRVGDFDPFAIPVIMRRTGKSLEEVLSILASESGLLGISGFSGDIRDLEEASASGNDRAQLALDVYVSEIRRHLGGMMVALEGADAIAFTGGIGENGASQRQAICRNLDAFGIELDSQKNSLVNGEREIHSDSSACEVWVVPTNEEIIVARQTVECLKGS